MKSPQFYIVLLLYLFSSISSADSSLKPVIYKKVILSGGVDLVWSALTDHHELEKWWNKGVKLEPVVGGQFYEPWGNGQLATGVVLKLNPLKSIEFSWREKYWQKTKKTICEFTLEEASDKTTLYVRHSGWELFKNETRRQQLIKGFDQGWNSLLSKLKRHIEPNK